MNNFPSITIVGWETRNWRHAKKVLACCKDYGFKPITKYVFVGQLYAKERREMQEKFEALLTNKTEKFFFTPLCKSCYGVSMLGIPPSEYLGQTPLFELIQVPKNSKK